MRHFFTRRIPAYHFIVVAVFLCCSSRSANAQVPPVTARTELVKGRVEKPSPHRSGLDNSNVVVWLTPLGNNASTPPSSGSTVQPKLTQYNKRFEPHLLVVEVGTVVQFPNKDPFFHNIFSLFDGKRFDLGLYEAGTTRSVRFDRPGVSYLFCNIHAEMSAVIIAVETPYFGLSNQSGIVTIRDVPNGRYQMHVWYERSQPEDLKELTRMVTISDSGRNLDPIKVQYNSDFTSAHKNKYGEDYVPPPSPGYNGR